MGVVPGPIVNALDNIMVAPDKPLKRAYAGSSVVTLTTGDYMGTIFSYSFRGNMLYFPSQEIDIDGAGTYTLTPPSWAKHIAIIAFGGGKGGECGNGGNNTAGKGGNGSQGIVYTLNSEQDSTVTSLTVTIGKGGAGGTGSSKSGKDGGDTKVFYTRSNGNTYNITAGGATTASTAQNGNVRGWNASGAARHRARIYNKNRPTATTAANDYWTPSTYGFGDGEKGTPGGRGGGGAGGHGGIFGNYANGGYGGDGYVYIHYMGSNPYTCVEYMKRYAEHFRPTTEVSAAFRNFLTDRGFTPETIDSIPFYIDIKHVADLGNMFYEFFELRYLHDLDFSAAENVASMFGRCGKLAWGPKCVNANNLVDARYMFFNAQVLGDRNISIEMNTAPSCDITDMTSLSGLSYPPFYSPDGQPYF